MFPFRVLSELKEPVDGQVPSRISVVGDEQRLWIEASHNLTQGGPTGYPRAESGPRK